MATLPAPSTERHVWGSVAGLAWLLCRTPRGVPGAARWSPGGHCGRLPLRLLRLCLDSWGFCLLTSVPRAVLVSQQFEPSVPGAVPSCLQSPRCRPRPAPSRVGHALRTLRPPAHAAHVPAAPAVAAATVSLSRVPFTPSVLLIPPSALAPAPYSAPVTDSGPEPAHLAEGRTTVRAAVPLCFVTVDPCAYRPSLQQHSAVRFWGKVCSSALQN